MHVYSGFSLEVLGGGNIVINHYMHMQIQAYYSLVGTIVMDL